MAKETPLQKVKRLYGSKEKLVDTVVDVAKNAGEEMAAAKDRLRSVSNQKLLRMVDVSKLVKEKYGNKAKLADTIGKAVGRAKDKDYVAKLGSLSSARLLDMVKSAEKRVRSAAQSKSASK